MSHASFRPRLLQTLVAAIIVLLAIQSASAQRGLTFFAVPNSYVTAPVKVNNRGVVAGVYSSEMVQNGVFIRQADGTIDTVELTDAMGFVRQYLDLNLSGTLVGTYLSDSVIARGFIRTPDGTTTPFDIPGAALTVLSGINDRGTMIGAYIDATLSFGEGFMVDPDGVITEITGPANVLYLPMVIGATGVVAGVTQSFSDTGTQTGELFHRDARGVVTHFDLPATSTRQDVTRVEVQAMWPVDVNTAGDVTGHYSAAEFVGDQYVGSFIRGFVRHRDGSVETFSAGDESTTELYVAGIDASGGIVGDWNMGDGVWSGFRLGRNGRYSTIAIDGAASTRVFGVSPSGLVVGTAVPSDFHQTGQAMGFILRSGSGSTQ